LQQTALQAPGNPVVCLSLVKQPLANLPGLLRLSIAS